MIVNDQIFWWWLPNTTSVHKAPLIVIVLVHYCVGVDTNGLFPKVALQFKIDITNI